MNVPILIIGAGPVGMTMASELARYGVPIRIIDAFADAMTEVTIGYPRSPLNGPSLAGAGPKPGQRVGPLSGQVPVGAGSAPRFALFATNTSATADLVGRFPGLLDRDVRPPFRDGGIWLVRPDGYLACSSSDTEAVANYLDRLVHARAD
jgi:hypothetical protein